MAKKRAKASRLQKAVLPAPTSREVILPLLSRSDPAALTDRQLRTLWREHRADRRAGVPVLAVVISELKSDGSPAVRLERRIVPLARLPQRPRRPEARLEGIPLLFKIGIDRGPGLPTTVTKSELARWFQVDPATVRRAIRRAP